MEVKRGLGAIWGNLNGLYRLMKQPERSAAFGKKAVDQAREAVTADPTNAVAQRDLVASLGNLGLSLSALGDYEAQRAVETEVLALQRGLLKADPDNVQSLRDLSDMLVMSAQGAFGRKEYALAEARYRELLQVVAAARASGGDSTAEADTVAHDGLASLREAQGRFEEALAENALVVSGLEAVLAQSPGLKRLENRLAMAVATQGEYRVKLAETLARRRCEGRLEAGEGGPDAGGTLEALEQDGANTGTAEKPHEEAKALLVTVNKALKKK